ncbi:GTP pyrophosphokinase [Polyangium sorediatum]|uniref:RelA/SpoT domain-containing protein n=1 Tax=Polyangium sorediatum TaxID=889274 RepID=A0ABT6NZW3_9BACT|nr:RelA/SpoT domain-containing protein [Polyangium sorediatum]MDI1433874.1 RelA/SpoT domain-containing protein [Polyangium sorediatum]
MSGLLPADNPEVAPLLEPEIERLVQQYIREMARYEKAAAIVADKLRRELRAEARLRHLISFRAKHPDDLREKLRRKAKDNDAKYRYDALRDDLNGVVTDLAGCRVVVYVPEDELRVVDLVDRVFRSPARSDARPAQYQKPTGYRATHRLVIASESPEEMSVSGAICEIQITTLAAHLFNELEHDITYKEHGQKPSLNEREMLEHVLHAARLADHVVGTLLVAHRQTTRDHGVLDNPEALRFALEHEAGRALAGDFVRLHRMLDASVEKLNMTTLRTLGNVKQVLLRGRAKASALKLDSDVDDVVCFALGLPAQYEEFASQAKSWRGPETPLKQALLLVAEESVDTSLRTTQDNERSHA